MVLVYVQKSTSRIKYAFNLLLRDLIQVPFELCNDPQIFEAHEGAKFSYHSSPLGDELFIQANNLLFENGIIEQEIVPFDWNDTTAFFATSSKSNFEFDIFAAAFYMAVRYEEYLPHKRDAHDRFEATQSITTKFNFIEKPVVNQWSEEFWLLLKTKFPTLTRKERTYQFITTVDVDNAFAYKEKGFVRTVAGFLKDLFSLQFKRLKTRFLVTLNQQKDPYDTYSYQLEMIQKHQLKFIYFFLIGDYGMNDKNIPLSNRAFQSLIKQLGDYAQVGIHPSYGSNEHFKKLEKEVIRLEPILKREITQSRQHFLRVKFPETYRNLIELDIFNDYSLGYNTHCGFRAGLCTPFYFYDLDLEVETRLLIHPFAVMEGTLKYFLNLKPKEAIEKYQQLIDEVKQVNGTFISMWHNDSLCDEGEWEGWKSTFEKMIEYGKS